MLGVRLRPVVVLAVVALAALAPRAMASEPMTLEEKVGQLFVPYAYGASAADPDPAMVAANRALFGLDNFEQVIAKYHVGGFIYYAWSNNLANPAAIAQLSNGVQRASRVPLLISTDQEQGIVTRMPAPATELPGAMAIGATRKEGFAKTGGAITAKELRAVGINQNFAM
jgi:beta-N-acetylhexosaminidase